MVRWKRMRALPSAQVWTHLCARGRDTTILREILDKTAEGLDKTLTNQPEVEVEMREILAEFSARVLGLHQSLALQSPDHHSTPSASASAA